MFDTVLWYFTDYMDMKPINDIVNSVLGIFMTNPEWKFDAEHVTVINAGTIILLQILISKIVKNTKALPTMITGIALGTLGMGILAISTHAWVFMAGIIIFSIGEMTAHPKFISYVGLIAPEDKKALYLGYAFLYGVLGSGIGGVLGANLYVHFVDKLNNPSLLWFIFSLIGVVTIIGLLLYNRFIAVRHSDI
jgi:MFS family permease